MTIAIDRLRQFQDQTIKLLHQLIENAFVTRFTYSSEMPITPMQYWEYELSIWEHDEAWHNLK